MTFGESEGLEDQALCGSDVKDQYRQIWGPTFKTYLGKLSVLQNKALRIIARGNWLDTATQYCVKLNILKLDDLYKFEIAKVMHQLVNNKLLRRFSSFLLP